MHDLHKFLHRIQDPNNRGFGTRELPALYSKGVFQIHPPGSLNDAHILCTYGGRDYDRKTTKITAPNFWLEIITDPEGGHVTSGSFSEIKNTEQPSTTELHFRVAGNPIHYGVQIIRSETIQYGEDGPQFPHQEEIDISNIVDYGGGDLSIRKPPYTDYKNTISITQILNEFLEGIETGAQPSLEEFLFPQQ